MTWNYRVMRTGSDGGACDHRVGIHEVYYDDAGAVVNWSADPVSATAFDEDDLKWRLHEMLAALGKPVLDCSPGTTGGEQRVAEDAADAPTG